MKLYTWKDIKRLLAVNSLFKQSKILHNFSNMNTLFMTAPLRLSQTPHATMETALQDMPEGLNKWVEERSLTALLVLKNGTIAHEAYYQGTTMEELRISWSVAKSFLSALLGVVLEEGDIASIDDPVTKYVPLLRGSAYEGASIRNVLNMSSGVAFNEDYLDFHSDINKMGRVIGLGSSLDTFASKVDRSPVKPGARWLYVSIDTHIIGMVIREATGRDIPELMVEKLLAPMGICGEAYYLTDGDGVAFVLGGLNMRTRDYARLGQMFLQGGKYNGTQIVSPEWIAESTAPSAPTDANDETKYGYQWWVPLDAHKGEYFARGIYGQYVYVDENADVVIAINSTDRLFREPESFPQNLAMFRKITAGLA